LLLTGTDRLPNSCMIFAPHRIAAGRGHPSPRLARTGVEGHSPRRRLEKR
jgi:hypothetical protein